MSEPVLKPCPFCGSMKAKVVIETECFGHGFFLDVAYIKCPECEARTKSFDAYCCRIDECKVRAIEAWNRRAGDDFLVY